MLVSIILLFAVVFQSCNKVSGEGPVVSQTFSTGNFSSLESGIDADVFYTQDSFYKVEIQAQQNILNLVRTPIVNGELRLQFEKFRNVSHREKIIVNITAPSLVGLGINGSGTLRALQPLSVPSLKLKVNGSGNVSISQFSGATLSADVCGSGNISVSSGNTIYQQIQISGSGAVSTPGLIAKNVTADISGSGYASVQASDFIDVSISGSGDLYYIGNPSVHQSISGSGKVSRQ